MLFFIERLNVIILDFKCHMLNLILPNFQKVDIESLKNIYISISVLQPVLQPKSQPLLQRVSQPPLQSVLQPVLQRV